MHGVIAEEWDREVDESSGWQRRWEVALSTSFERANSEVVTAAVAPEMVGSTAAIVVLSDCQIITANCGDSRVVLCRGTETIALTVYQKVTMEIPLYYVLIVYISIAFINRRFSSGASKFCFIK